MIIPLYYDHYTYALITRSLGFYTIKFIIIYFTLTHYPLNFATKHQNKN